MEWNLVAKIKFHSNKSRFIVKSWFKESNGADRGHSLNRDLTVLSLTFNSQSLHRPFILLNCVDISGRNCFSFIFSTRQNSVDGEKQRFLMLLLFLLDLVAAFSIIGLDFRIIHIDSIPRRDWLTTSKARMNSKQIRNNPGWKKRQKGEIQFVVLSSTRVFIRWWSRIICWRYSGFRLLWLALSGHSNRCGSYIRRYFCKWAWSKWPQ